MNAIAVFDPLSSFNSGKISGFCYFHQPRGEESKTQVHIKLLGLPPNTKRGIHIHEEGDLTKGCESLCSHYNPLGTKHGSIELYGNDRHAGDMINNVVSDKKGEVDIWYDDELIDL